MDNETLEHAWDLAESMMEAVTHIDPDWLAIELSARELAELAASERRSGA